MNINLGANYAVHPEGGQPQSVADILNEHLTVLATGHAGIGLAFTGRQALLPETDLPDAYRVWNETNIGTWVWVDTDGVVHETSRPLNYSGIL